MACPTTCFIIVRETMCSCRLLGLRSRSSYVGASVARAREASVSIMRFIQSIWMGAKICCFIRAAPMRVISTATTLMVSWNWMNLRIESKMLRPQSTALTMELKLSSKRMMAAA
jgi:hypothetical protein